MNDFLFRVCAVAVLVFGASSTLEAAPVILRFEGEIVEIRKSGNPLFDLPTDIAIGQPASLELTFEPIPFPKAARTIGTFIVPGGKIVLRPLGLKLVLNGVVLSDDAATLFVDHDPLVAGLAGISERELLYTRGMGALPLSNDILWSTDEGFANQGSVFDGGEYLGDPEVWNLLPLRSITTVFDGPGTGLIHVTTAFGDAAVVPEPSSMTCIAMISLIIGAFSLASRSSFTKQ